MPHSPKNDLFAVFIDRLADAVAARLEAKRNGAAPAARRSTAGRKLDMRCRVAGCRNRSKGPRFGFICDDHLKKLSKKQQQAARDAWKAKHASA